ncbi:MAG: hypothetical protein ACI89J_004557 [Hyphomicrobiaceae bacterium]|jgi:hypothetical protein
MKTILYRVTRLFHPITLAVVLVGVAGFLLGLIVAVERQDAALVAPAAGVEDVSRIAHLETTLAGREAEVAELQAELTRQRAEEPSPPPASDEAERRIASLEAAVVDNIAERNSLQGELTGLSGQLAEAIQARDDLRAQNERERLVAKNERANFEQMISVLRRELKAAEQRARSEVPVAAVREDTPPSEAPAEEASPVAAEPPDLEPAVAASSAPAEAPAEVTAPAEPSRAGAETPEPQAEATPAPVGPITRGIKAYQAAEYGKAYELWLPQALKGSTRAQFYVGALYLEGRGVAEDRVQSYMWLRAATKNNDPGAIKLLDRVREGMTGPELAEAETRIASGETIPSR